MRKTYHLSFASHDEVLYRNEADYVIGFNCLAEAILYTETRALSEGQMSTHWHAVCQTDSPKELAKRARYAYTRYFNAKYRRKGRFGDHYVFCTEIEGYHRTLSALNYVNRQGLHHGVASSPFEYPHCSANSFFRAALGKQEVQHFMPNQERHRFLTRNITVPESYRMDENGQLLREDILDIKTVEQYYITPRSFIYQMNRYTDEKILSEQREEESSTPVITIDLIESCDPDYNVNQMLVNEQGKVNRNHMTDTELCCLIDNYYLPMVSRSGEEASIYTITSRQRQALFEALTQDLRRSRSAGTNDARTPVGKAGLAGKYASDKQLVRCLAMNYQP